MPDKRLPLQSLLNDGLKLVEVFCCSQGCHHHASVMISYLIEKGVSPDTSLDDLPLRCTKCNGTKFEARLDMAEYYRKIGRDTQGGYITWGMKVPAWEIDYRRGGSED